MGQFETLEHSNVGSTGPSFRGGNSRILWIQTNSWVISIFDIDPTRHPIWRKQAPPSQFMCSRKNLHWVAMKKILRYLSGTQRLGIILNKVLDYSLCEFCDTDWRGETMDRKVRLSACLCGGGTLMSWSSKKQNTLARPITEAEYWSIATTVELEGIKALLTELGVTVPLPIQLISDNQSTTFIANNLICHTKLKHVAMDFRFVREKTEQVSLVVKHIPGTVQRANILTKALQPKPFKELQGRLVGEAPPSLRGRVNKSI